ncbi:hypothetical protein OG453_44225 [Streptomyces sp. NBC_01381]|uniref:hypothetical protein n=1 Tax=Streptomyces sp. NBC_01381 TaxID=2903845 RepID=UPI00224CD9D8|nr:hypothetical protein [Streptomyces sp. NBC_01381]MCX4673567.1 hypothetical protein [Streptomyces sp. NBC_01381]
MQHTNTNTITDRAVLLGVDELETLDAPIIDPNPAFCPSWFSPSWFSPERGPVTEKFPTVGDPFCQPGNFDHLFNKLDFHDHLTKVAF